MKFINSSFVELYNDCLHLKLKNSKVGFFIFFRVIEFDLKLIIFQFKFFFYSKLKQIIITIFEEYSNPIYTIPYD
jgi:hypothetical protein